MYSESFRYIDHKFIEDLLSAVTYFCNEVGVENIVSITGSPRKHKNHDMVSSDDKLGYNYSGGYTVWYKK